MTSLLQEQTLVLNNSYLAIQVWDAKYAICALVAGKVDVIDKDYNLYNLLDWSIYSIFHSDDTDYPGVVRSPSTQLLVPQVVRINYPTNAVLSPRYINYSRCNVYNRDNYTCQYCHKKLSSKQLTLDHVVPKSKGGATQWSNVITCCKKCNNIKGEHLLSELKWKAVSPQVPQWKSHISKPFNQIKKQYWAKFLS